MKSYLKLLLAALLALTLIFVCVSCDGGAGAGSAGGGTNITIVPNPEPAVDTYLIDFVYRYTTTYINDFDRMEQKEFNQRVERIEIPVNNTGLTDEHRAKINAILYNGYGFAGWYSEWDSENNTVSGSAYDFATATGAITGDMEFYADRGILAGADSTWEITTEGEGKDMVTTLNIKGTGATFDFAVVNELDIPWYGRRAEIDRIVVEEGITTIGSNTFNGLTAVGEIVLPDSLKEIRDSAFKNNKKLRLLETPDNLVTLGSNAFSNNTGLKGVILNDGLETIGESAFTGSYGITYVVIPASLKSVGASAFHPGSTNNSQNNSKLKTVYSKGTKDQFKAIDIGISNTWFSELASVYYTDPSVDLETTPGPYWSYDSVTGEPVPEYFIVKYMLDSAIYGSKIPFNYDYLKTSVEYEEVEVEEVIVNEETGEEETITTTETVAKVTAEATEANELYPWTLSYHGYDFVSFIFPTVDKQEKPIVAGAIFDGDVEVTCSPYTNKNYNSGYLSKNNGIKWTYSKGVVTIVTVAKQGTAENVKNFFAQNYDKVVSDNTAISEIITEDAKKEFAAKLLETFSVGDESYASCNTVGKLTAKIAADQSALGVFKIWDYHSPEDTSGLWLHTRSNASEVTSIVFAEGSYIEHIGSYAFAAVRSIESVEIPASVTSIDVTAFSGCSSLEAIYYGGTDANLCKVLRSGASTDKIITADGALEGIHASAFAKADAATAESGSYWFNVGEGNNKTVVAWKLADGVLTLGGPAAMFNFDSAEATPWYPAKDSISSIVIESHITSISENLANGYANVASIKFDGANVRIIPKSAFAGTGIVANASSYDSKGLLIINDYLIASKTDAAYVEIPFYTIAVAEGAFDGCTAIKELYIPRTVQGLHKNVFDGISLETIYFEGTSTTWKATTASINTDEVLKDVKIALLNYNPLTDKENTSYYGFVVNKDGSFTLYQGEKPTTEESK